MSDAHGHRNLNFSYRKHEIKLYWGNLTCINLFVNENCKLKKQIIYISKILWCFLITQKVHKKFIDLCSRVESQQFALTSTGS